MKVKLREIADLYNGDRGKNYPSSDEITKHGEIPFVNAGLLVDDHICFKDMNYISKEKYDLLNAGKFHEGDILYCLRGSLGKKAIVGNGEYGAIASSLVIIRPYSDKISSEYLLCALDSPDIQRQLHEANNGSSQPNLSAKSVSNYSIDLPDLNSQYTVVEKIHSVQRLINWRKRELNILDDLIKARFVEMFGDDSFPEKRLGEVCSKITDGTHKTPNYVDDGITFISAKNIVNGVLDFSDVKYISDEEYEEIQKRCQTEKMDILLSKSGTLGTPAIVKTEDKLGLFESLAVIKYDRSQLLPDFLCEQLKSDEVQRQFRTGTKGVAVKHLHLGVIADTKIVVPPLDIQKVFAAFVEQVDKSKAVVQKSLDETQTLFDSLMQQYFG